VHRVKIGKVRRTPFVKKNWPELKASFYILSETARRLKGQALNKLETLIENSSPAGLTFCARVIANGMLDGI